MPREVLVRYTSGPNKDKEYVVASAAQAKKAHPDAKIVSFHPTGEPYRESKDTKAAEREAQPAVAAAEKAADAKTDEKKS